MRKIATRTFLVWAAMTASQQVGLLHWRSPVASAGILPGTTEYAVEGSVVTDFGDAAIVDFSPAAGDIGDTSVLTVFSSRFYLGVLSYTNRISFGSVGTLSGILATKISLSRILCGDSVRNWVSPVTGGPVRTIKDCPGTEIIGIPPVFTGGKLSIQTVTEELLAAVNLTITSNIGPDCCADSISIDVQGGTQRFAWVEEGRTGFFNLFASVSSPAVLYEILPVDPSDPSAWVTAGPDPNGVRLTYGDEELRQLERSRPVVCPVTLGDDACLIDWSTDQNRPINALTGNDTLQFGRGFSFSFDVSKIDSIYTNFETFEKIDDANVTLTGTAATAANWDVLAGTLTVSGGNAIFNTSAVNVRSGAAFAVAASETVGRLTGAGALTLAAGQALTTGDETDTSFTGTTSGAGGLTKAGAGKFSTLNLGHTGLTTVAGGELNANGLIAGSVQIDAGATLSGANTIAGNLTNLGTLKSGNSPGSTIVGGNYAGGGLVAVEVVFNSAGAPVNGMTHDYLQVGGNVAGTTQLSIMPFGLSTAPTATTGNGIELVRVGGAVAADAFALAGPVIQGGFEYLLKHLPDYSATTDGFFLQSAARQELSLHAAMLSAGRDTLRSCARTSSGNPGLNGEAGRAWASGQFGSLDAKGSSGLKVDADTDCYGGGADFALTSDFHVGLSGGFGTTQADVTIPQGRASLDGEGSVIEARAAFVAGGFYAQASGGYTSTDWDIVKAGGGRLSAKVDGMVGSFETGYRISFDEPSTLTLSAGLNYDGSTCGDGCLLAGTIEAASEWTAKLGARFDVNFADSKIKPFIAIGLSDDLNHGQSIAMGNAVANSDTASMIFDVGAGLDMQIDDNVSVFANGGYTRGFDTQAEGYQATLGARVTW